MLAPASAVALFCSLILTLPQRPLDPGPHTPSARQRSER